MIATGARMLQIADHGKVLTLDYSGACAAHAGRSWFGVAVGFRMLQAAGQALSQQGLWSRETLYVVSGHPGDGVRDVVEYVTGCVSRGYWRVDAAGPGCRRGMRFEWEIRNADARVDVRLRDGSVPEQLYALLDRRGTPAERSGDAENFDALKRQLAEQVWREPLDRLFTLERTQAEVARHA